MPTDDTTPLSSPPPPASSTIRTATPSIKRNMSPSPSPANPYEGRAPSITVPRSILPYPKIQRIQVWADEVARSASESFSDPASSIQDSSSSNSAIATTTTATSAPELLADDEHPPLWHRIKTLARRVRKNPLRRPRRHNPNRVSPDEYPEGFQGGGCYDDDNNVVNMPPLTDEVVRTAMYSEEARLAAAANDDDEDDEISIPSSREPDRRILAERRARLLRAEKLLKSGRHAHPAN